MNELAALRTVDDVIAEYEGKRDAIPDAIKAYDQARDTFIAASAVLGNVRGQIISGSRINERDMAQVLRQSAWLSLYKLLQIDRIASADDKQRFHRTIEQAPELTRDNAAATFGDYLINTRHHILKGLAQVFSKLDPAYRSHTKVAIGRKGLPKRVIIGGFSSFHGYGFDQFRDLFNALCVYRGEPLFGHDDYEVSAGHTWDRDTLVYERAGLTVQRFKNGNAHVHFDERALNDINAGLAEFYGDVLPDVDEQTGKPVSTAVAKDLQFYWTPDDVVDRLITFAEMYGKGSVLEPSCGDGRILDGLLRAGFKAFGIEYDANRARQARYKGHQVLCANFLEQVPDPAYDYVLMNPPFYGQHYRKHIEHALKWLKEGGVLAAILPASAWYDHKHFDGRWQDLPVASFAAAGTNVPTGMLRMCKP